MATVTLNGDRLTDQESSFLRIDEDALHVLANQHGAGLARDDFEVKVAIKTGKSKTAKAEPEVDADEEEQPYEPDSNPPKDEGKKAKPKPSGSTDKAVHVDGPLKTLMTGSAKDADRPQTKVESAEPDNVDPFWVKKP